jgi:hypothetical protein
VKYSQPPFQLQWHAPQSKWLRLLVDSTAGNLVNAVSHGWHIVLAGAQRIAPRSFNKTRLQLGKRPFHDDLVLCRLNIGK